jgi:hypothetical protein
VTLAILLIVRNGAPSEENPPRIGTIPHQHLVAAT